MYAFLLFNSQKKVTDQGQIFRKSFFKRILFKGLLYIILLLNIIFGALKLEILFFKNQYAFRI